MNIYNYMRNTSKEVTRQGILKYLEEYSHSDEVIKNSNFHLQLLRIRRNKKHKTDRAQLFDSVGRSVYKNLNISDDWNKIIPFLSSIELIITSAYLIDDIVDKQEKRFNNDTTWKKYGLNEAIFAAFRLREIAEKVIIEKQDCSLENKVKILDLISDFHRKTYDGQSINERLIANFNYKRYIERCEYLGGIFINSVAKGSAILANTNDKTLKLVEKIGNNYGIAVMIRDDLKDYMTTELIETKFIMSKTLKRTTLEDFRNKRITYPLHIALNDKKYETELRALMGKEKLTLDEEKEIVSMVANSGGLDKTIDLIEKYKQKTLEFWKELPENESKYIFKDLINLMKNSRNYTNKIKEYIKNE